MSSEPIGIIGAGRLGQALARTARRAGRPVVIANKRGPESLAPVIADFDAAGFAPIDLGDLVAGGVMQQWGGPLAGHNLVRIPAPWE